MDEIRKAFAKVNGVSAKWFSFNSEGGCSVCKGTGQITYEYDFFENAKIRKLLQSMIDVGLDYLTLGQPTSTLSGGEVQRVKLASELHKQGQVYVLDEPSTGLHVKDIEKLLALLRKLVDDGNTVVMIEHRPELIAQADWIIDIGPEGSSKGGEIVFIGTPEQILTCKKSKTGKYL